MELPEVIIRAHVRVRGAELAYTSGGEEESIHELSKLRQLLNEQPELEAGGASKSTG